MVSAFIIPGFVVCYHHCGFLVWDGMLIFWGFFWSVLHESTIYLEDKVCIHFCYSLCTQFLPPFTFQLATATSPPKSMATAWKGPHSAMPGVMEQVWVWALASWHSRGSTLPVITEWKKLSLSEMRRQPLPVGGGWHSSKGVSKAWFLVMFL